MKKDIAGKVTVIKLVFAKQSRLPGKPAFCQRDEVLIFMMPLKKIDRGDVQIFL